MKFTNKQTYLAYRSEWKSNYNALSQRIREVRSGIRDLQKNKKYAGALQYAKFKLRAEAKAMIEELKFAKQEANQQYLNQKQMFIAA